MNETTFGYILFGLPIVAGIINIILIAKSIKESRLKP